LQRRTRENPRIQRPEFTVRLIAKLASDFLRDESGATAIEYALIATGISIVIVVAVNGIGSSVNGRFVAVGDAFK
jgi:pilus assembly protein Flp/PilA